MEPLQGVRFVFRRMNSLPAQPSAGRTPSPSPHGRVFEPEGGPGPGARGPPGWGGAGGERGGGGGGGAGWGGGWEGLGVFFIFFFF
jgi:hypothetical protein